MEKLKKNTLLPKFVKRAQLMLSPQYFPFPRHDLDWRNENLKQFTTSPSARWQTAFDSHFPIAIMSGKRKILCRIHLLIAIFTNLGNKILIFNGKLSKSYSVFG